MVRFTRHGISRTDTIINQICFTQHIGMNVRNTIRGCKSIVHPFSDRKLMVSSFVSHQISTSFLVGKSGSSCVCVWSVYCSMKTFVTFSRDSSRFCESCVGIPTCLYVDTLNWFWEYPRVIDRTSFLCALTHTEAGTRVRLLSPGVVFFNPDPDTCPSL